MPEMNIPGWDYNRSYLEKLVAEVSGTAGKYPTLGRYDTRDSRADFWSRGGWGKGDGKGEVVSEGLSTRARRAARASVHVNHPDAAYRLMRELAEHSLDLCDHLEASEARCKELEEALRLLVHRTKTTRERLNAQGVTVPLWTEISFSDAYEKALGVLGEGGLLERREEGQ